MVTDVLCDLLKRICRHVQPVARLTALGRGVFKNEVLARGASDSALHHLDVLSNTVLLVHDEVARHKLQWVDSPTTT